MNFIYKPSVVSGVVIFNPLDSELVVVKCELVLDIVHVFNFYLIVLHKPREHGDTIWLIIFFEERLYLPRVKVYSLGQSDE